MCEGVCGEVFEPQSVVLCLHLNAKRRLSLAESPYVSGDDKASVVYEMS